MDPTITSFIGIDVAKETLDLHARPTNQSLSVHNTPSGFKKILSRGNPDVLCDAANKTSRLPFGHPDGFIEAVANGYLEFYRGVRAVLAGKPVPKNLDHPDIDDGVIGMAFIDTILASAKSKSKWTKMKK